MSNLDKAPSFDQWIQEAKQDPQAHKVGMYLTHCGVVRGNSRAGDPVAGMNLSYDPSLLQDYIEQALNLPGIYYVRVWINEGNLNLGDDIMRVLIGGDIRPNTVDALTFLVGHIKSEVVVEEEIHA